jgi:hypothetical protein
MIRQQLIAALLLIGALLLLRTTAAEIYHEAAFPSLKSTLFPMSGCGPGCRI